MKTIKIAYGLTIEGLQFKEIDFSDTTPEFKNIALKLIDEGNRRYELLIRKAIYSSSDTHIKAMLNEASTEAERFKYVFSVAADVKIFNFECLGYYQNGQLVKYNNIFGIGLRVSINGTFRSTAGEPLVKEIKKRMQDKYDLPPIQMFYDAATVVEMIGRFLSLYTLLLHKFSDNQKTVDEAILSVDPTVAQFRSPHVKWYETVFSKLRNEMSHKREGTKILETQNEIKVNIDRFEAIVKKLILGGP